ncbi:MAG: hypothetical protein CMH54_10595 [Myxococcales bacterium]|nr:hypothetical protein [Myxococcales bacterium]
MQIQYEVLEPYGERVLPIEPLLAAHTIVLSTHVNPDGDGLGAGLALMRGLRALGKEVRMYLDAPIPERYKYLDYDGDVMEADAMAADFIRDADLYVALDTNDMDRTGRPYVMRGDAPVCAIDHHLGDVPDHVIMICDTDSSSTGELVYRILVQAGVTITPEIGEPIYASMVYDTVSFRFLRNRSETLRLAARLLDLGVDATRLQEKIYMNKPVDMPRLLARAFKRAEFAYDNRIAWTILDASDLADLSVDNDDLREVVSMLISLRGVEAAFVLKQAGDKQYKVSIRSKEHLNIFSIAKRRGGGGHAHAAGATVDGDVGPIIEDVLGEIAELLS